jgi:hypothetical protein
MRAVTPLFPWMPTGGTNSGINSPTDGSRRALNVWARRLPCSVSRDRAGAAGRRDDDALQVLVDIQFAAVHPERPIEMERHLLELPRELRDACNPPGLELAHPLEPEVGRVAGIEGREAADVIAAIHELGCSTPMITHRETGAALADDIVVLDGGRVVDGGPAELVARSDGSVRATLAGHRLLRVAVTRQGGCRAQDAAARKQNATTCSRWRARSARRR